MLNIDVSDVMKAAAEVGAKGAAAVDAIEPVIAVATELTAAIEPVPSAMQARKM